MVVCEKQVEAAKLGACRGAPDRRRPGPPRVSRSSLELNVACGGAQGVGKDQVLKQSDATNFSMDLGCSSENWLQKLVTLGRNWSL